MTLIELLVAVGVVGIAAAGISGLILLNHMSSTRLANKVDNLNAARAAIERISKDVRMARNIGDVYGSDIVLDAGSGTTGTEGADQFPIPAAAGGHNPHYSGSTYPPNFAGWPSVAPPYPEPPWPARPWRLSNRCLIVQVPVFDANGFPTMVPKCTGDPPVQSNQDNVDTIVYQVLPDPANAGEYVMQVAGFPGFPSNLALRSNPPQTLVKGIIGPLDAPGGEPKVFQYLDRADPTGTPKDPGAAGWNPATIANFTGVIVNLEVKRSQENTTAESNVAIKGEVFMRNNKLSTITPPNPVGCP